MATHTIKNLPASTYEIAVTIPWSDVVKEKEHALDTLIQHLEIPGYRKGKVPKDLAKNHIKDEALYRELLNTMLPSIYSAIVKEENLKPIISPKVELVEAREDADWRLTITTAGEPIVELGDYKKVIADAKGELKKDDLWVPGKSETADPKEESTKKQRKISAILDALLQNVSIDISPLVIESEVESRLSHLLDEIQKIGLTVDSYLKSKNTTMDSLRASLQKEVEDTYKLEFILMAIADAEHISVEKEELDKLFGSVADEKEKAAVVQNAYMYATVLRKQKTLDFLASI